MTKQKALEVAKILQAYAEDKQIEFISAYQWRAIPADHTFDFDKYRYRIKPTPTQIPLEPQDMLQVKWIRYKRVLNPALKSILLINVHYVVVVGDNQIPCIKLTYEELAKHYEYTTNGITWHNCTKESA